MPAKIILKSIPDDVDARPKLSAKTHRRSLNSEAIAGLEAALFPKKIATAERLARARELRNGLSVTKFNTRDIDTLRRAGRP